MKLTLLIGKKIELPGVTHPEYLKLYSPALEWQLQCIAYKAAYPMLESILEKYSFFFLSPYVVYFVFMFLIFIY